jgi:hypothetical protein
MKAEKKSSLQAAAGRATQLLKILHSDHKHHHYLLRCDELHNIAI